MTGINIIFCSLRIDIFISSLIFILYILISQKEDFNKTKKTLFNGSFNRISLMEEIKVCPSLFAITAYQILCIGQRNQVPLF